MSVTSETPPRILYEIRLQPHRSLSSEGFRRIMLGVVVGSVVIGGGMYFAGAWPVFGFLGVDIVLVYVALRASFRSARISERLELNERELVVERVGAKGGVSQWTFQPNWLRVELAERLGRGPTLSLRSHGRSFPIGAFLHPDQLRNVARELSRALERWRLNL